MRVLLPSLVALLVVVGSSGAQTDPARALVGVWKGDVRLLGNERGNPARVLLIGTPSQEDGKWTSEGRYGLQSPTNPVKIDIDTAGSRVAIRFVTPVRIRS